jgi:hypothetical protein
MDGFGMPRKRNGTKWQAGSEAKAEISVKAGFKQRSSTCSNLYLCGDAITAAAQGCLVRIDIHFCAA